MNYKTAIIVFLLVTTCWLILFWNKLDILKSKNIKIQLSEIKNDVKLDKLMIDLNKKVVDLKLHKSEQITTKNYDYKAHIVIFDLNSKLEPEIFYQPIQCRKSAKYIVETTLCIHPVDKDMWVSEFIWKNGVWENEIVDLFTKYVNNCSDCLVLDIGSNIGQYALFAAKIGRDVVAVEPFHDNILRIHKAAKTESIEKKITLIKNGLSDRRNHIMQLVASTDNIGGQYLRDERNQFASLNSSDKYVVETILFDDMIDYFPKKPNGDQYDRAIIKIDIESFEPFAFRNASLFFNKFKVEHIFMEWIHMGRARGEKIRYVENMIDLFILNKLNPISFQGVLLNRENWTNWPDDIIWSRA